MIYFHTPSSFLLLADTGRSKEKTKLYSKFSQLKDKNAPFAISGKHASAHLQSVYFEGKSWSSNVIFSVKMEFLSRLFSISFFPLLRQIQGS